MQKLTFLYVSLLLFLSLTVSAQNEKVPKKNGQIFQPKGEEFTVMTPTSFESLVYDGDVKVRRFTASVDGRFLFISSDLSTEPFHFKTVQDLLKQTVYKSKKEKLNNFEVEKISFDYSDDFFHKMWIIKTEQRIYIFHTASEVEDDDIVEKFFKSIKIDRKLVNKNETTELTFREGVGTSGNDSHRNQKSILGVALDTGISENSNISTSLPKPIDSNNSPFQIRLKPKANYTDFARFFEIQGSVILRTTFLKTGEIGTVSAITKLPFGLTKNAVEAAKKIKFKPMVKNGINVSLTKNVQYTFTIY